MLNKDIFISGIIMVVIDYFYLSGISNYFNNLLIKIQNEKIKLDYKAAIICYVFLIFGLYYFILKNKRPIKDAFLLGLIIYMVYENTNKAIFKNKVSANKTYIYETIAYLWQNPKFDFSEKFFI